MHSAPSIQKLLDELERLPGVGPKSAQRIAYWLLNADKATALRLAEAIVEVKAYRTVTRSELAAFRRQTLAERENAGAGVGILVVWRFSHPTADAVAHVTLRDLARLARPLRVNDGRMDEADGSWVSMTLGELCALIIEKE